MFKESPGQKPDNFAELLNHLLLYLKIDYRN